MRLVTALRPGRIALSITTAIMTVVLGAGPAAAATWTVAPGGPFTGHAGTTKLKDTTDGHSLPPGAAVAGVNMNSSRFKAAQAACRPLMPDGGP